MNGFVAGQFRISKPESGLPGQKASVYRSYDDEQFQKTTGLARKRTTGTKMPRENSIHHGVIVCTKEYGAFVQLGKGDKYKETTNTLTIMTMINNNDYVCYWYCTGSRFVT